MSLRHGLLGLLADHPASGYDLLGRFNTSLAQVWPAQQSQLYGELGRLTDAGFVEVVGVGARNRKEYAITDAGRAELRRWLVEVEPERVRNEMLLRVFFLWTVSQEQAESYLADYRVRMVKRGEELATLRDTVDWNGNEPARFARLALEYGLTATQAAAEWAQWAAEEVGR